MVGDTTKNVVKIPLFVYATRVCVSVYYRGGEPESEPTPSTHIPQRCSSQVYHHITHGHKMKQQPF